MKKFFDLYGNAVLDALFWTLCAASVVAIMWHADFIFGSEQYHMRYLAKGLPIPLMVDPSAGRIYPLTHCDCNFVLLLPHGLRPYIPQILYAANALIFLFTALLAAKLTRLEDSFGVQGRVLSFLAFVGFLTAPAVLLVSCWNSYPEQRMIFLMSLFAYAAFRWHAGRAIGWAVVAVLSAVLLFCYKESAFIVVGVFSATLLLGGWRRFDRPTRVFCLTLCALSVTYVALYACVILGRTTASYQDGHKIGLVPALTFHLLQPEIAVSLALAVVRAVFFILGRSGRHLFWDALLFSGVSFVLAYVVLQLTSPYKHYQCPAYVFLIPVLLHWLLALAKERKFGWWIGLVLLLSFIAANLHFTFPAIRSVLRRRDSEIPGLRVIASNPTVRHVYYYHPNPGYFEDHLFRTFSAYFGYAGCTLPIKSVNELKVDLGPDDVEVVPLCFGDVDFSVFEVADVLRTEWYAIIKGPCHGSAPVRCGREGVVVRAGERGMLGLYEAGGGTALGGKKVGLNVSLDQSICERPLVVELVAGAVSCRGKGSLVVRANGQPVYAGDAAYSPEKRRFEIPASCLTKGQVALEIESGEAVRPIDCGWSSDKRLLGVNFESIHLYAF